MGIDVVTVVVTPAASYDLASLTDIKNDLNIPVGVTLSTSADTPSGQVLPFLSTYGVSKGQTASGPNIQAGSIVQLITATAITLSLPVSGDVPAGSAILFNADTTVDAFLARQITLNSAAIQKYCNRQFPVETIQDTFNFLEYYYMYQEDYSLGILQLTKLPLSPVPATLVTNAASASGNVLNFAAVGGVTNGEIVASANVPNGTTVLSQTATSVALSQAVTATGVASGQAVQFGPAVAVTVNDPAGAYALVQNQDFSVDNKRGQLLRIDSSTGLPRRWDPYQTVVQYQAGFATIPSDIDDACSRMTKKGFWMRGRDPAVMERSNGQMGSEKFWVSPSSEGNLTADVSDLVG